MTCIYVHQAFNPNKSFGNVWSCPIFPNRWQKKKSHFQLCCEHTPRCLHVLGSFALCGPQILFSSPLPQCLSASFKNSGKEDVASDRMWVFTFYEERLLVIDVHETVSAGVAVASKRVPDQLLPRRLGDSDVVVLHPAALVRVVYVGPVVAGVGLAFVHQHCMKPIRDLGKQQR